MLYVLTYINFINITTIYICVYIKLKNSKKTKKTKQKPCFALEIKYDFLVCDCD